jgi:hypothetical protein
MNTLARFFFEKPVIAPESAKQSSDKAPHKNVFQSHWIAVVFAAPILAMWLFSAFVACAALVVSGRIDIAVEFLCSVITLVLAICVVVWICKIKNRQTEAVKVLEDILKEIKTQNVLKSDEAPALFSCKNQLLHP